MIPQPIVKFSLYETAHPVKEPSHAIRGRKMAGSLSLSMGTLRTPGRSVARAKAWPGAGSGGQEAIIIRHFHHRILRLFQQITFSLYKQIFEILQFLFFHEKGPF